jgi:hypothetical protein
MGRRVVMGGVVIGMVSVAAKGLHSPSSTPSPGGGIGRRASLRC